ncbi:Uncharacterized protein APZ42_016892 [Daphnia magna]|uniref:Uncharacterized protein n=1 Tax=Daphnia magna TaxID=35525 RepID=A0A165A7I9_9CRUS|nr:Uncharacterized protein APZ42_016892 [Daphnia magna]
MHLRSTSDYTEICRHDTPEIARDSRRAKEVVSLEPPGNNNSNNIGHNTHKRAT